MKCADFRDLPGNSAISLRDLHDCERHLQYCSGCASWFQMLPAKAPPYDLVWIHWQNVKRWLRGEIEARDVLFGTE